MGLRAKLIEKAAEQIVQTASKEISKHISKKAVDHAVQISKKKVAGTYSNVIEEFFGKSSGPPQPPLKLTPRERQIVQGWAAASQVIGEMTPEEHELWLKIARQRG